MIFKSNSNNDHAEQIHIKTINNTHIQKTSTTIIVEKNKQTGKEEEELKKPFIPH